MKQLLEDTLKVGASLHELVFMPTPIGRLQTQVRLARPNWSPGRCMKAAGWMKRSGLKSEADYGAAEEYQAQILRMLSEYAHAMRLYTEHQQADDLTLARWEDRWRRARTRVDVAAGSNQPNATQGEKKVA